MIPAVIAWVFTRERPAISVDWAALAGQGTAGHPRVGRQARGVYSLQTMRNRAIDAFATTLGVMALLSVPVSAGPPFRTDDPETVEYQHWEMTL